MSSLLSYHIFSFFISNIFENFKFGRNFSKFTAGMGCRLVAVSVKIGGNRRLPIGKENTVRDRGRDRAAAAGRWPVGEGALRGSAVRHCRPPGRRPLPRSGAEQGREREERERGSNCLFSQKKMY